MSLTPPPGQPTELTPCRKTGTQAYARIGSRKVSRLKQPSDGFCPTNTERQGTAPTDETAKAPRSDPPIPGRPPRRRHQPCKPEPPANPPIKTQPNEAPPQATPQTPTPQRTHRSSPYPPPKHPRQERENPAHRPRLRRAQPPPPPPAYPDAVGQYPEGRVRKMIPVSVCGASRPEVLAASTLSGIGATRSIPLWADPAGFFVIP